MNPRQTRQLHPGPSRLVADAALRSVLTRALADGDETGCPALEAVADTARFVRTAGGSPNEVAVLVRRALVAAAPHAMTVAALDALARRLIQHALRSYFGGDVHAAGPT